MVRWVTIPSSPPEETAAQRHKSLEVPQDTLKGILMGNRGHGGGEIFGGELAAPADGRASSCGPASGGGGGRQGVLWY